jgi:hypothetical protein
MRDEGPHLDVGKRPVLLTVPGDVPLNFAILSGHHCFFAHAAFKANIAWRFSGDQAVHTLLHVLIGRLCGNSAP